MGNFLYALLLIMSGSAVGTALIAAVMHLKMFLDGTQTADSNIRSHLRFVVTKVGIAVTQGVLVIRLTQVGTAESNPWAWGYLVGLLLVAGGLAGQAKDLIEQEARADALREVNEATKKKES